MKPDTTENSSTMWGKLSRFVWAMGYNRVNFWGERYYKFGSHRE